MQITNTHLITLSAFVLFSASARAGFVGVGDKSDGDLVTSLPKQVVDTAEQMGKGYVAGEMAKVQKTAGDVAAAKAVVQGIYSKSPLSNLKRDGGEDLQFTARDGSDMLKKVGTELADAVGASIFTSKTYNNVPNKRDFDPAVAAAGVEYVGTYVNDVAQELVNTNKRDVVIPPIEIVPGAGPKAQEFVNNVKQGFMDAAAKLYEAQPIVRRESKMQRQRRTASQ